MGSVEGALLVKNATCSKLLKDWDDQYSRLSQAKSGIVAQINAARSYINQIPAFTPTQDINDAAQDIIDNYKNMIPATDDYDTIVDIINQCAGLNDNDMFRTPTTLIKGITNAVTEQAFGAIRDLTSGLPEFDLADMIQKLLDSIGTGKLDSVLPYLNKILSCLSSFCGLDVTTRAQNLENFMNSCYVNDNGLFKLSGFLDTCISTPEANLNMQTCIESYEKVRKEVENKSGLAAVRAKKFEVTPKSAADYILPTKFRRYIPF